MTSLFGGRGKERIASALAPGDVDGDRRPGRAAVLALVCLGLLSGAATQAYADTVEVSFEPIEGRTDANARTEWVKEGSGTHNLKVKLNPAPTSALTVRYSVGGNANSGEDYTPLSGTLSVPAGATTAFIPVTIIDDSKPEAREEIAILLNLPIQGAGYRIARPYSHHLIIDPNDRSAWVSFASASQSAGEGSGTHDVGVRLNPAPSADITLAYTVGGTATAGSDFTIVNSGTVTVPKGTTTATIPVALIDDSSQEGSETVVLTLDGSAGYSVASPGTHTLTIVDDETPKAYVYSLSQADSEKSGTLYVRLCLWPAQASDTTVTYTVDGTATPGSDYTALSGTVTVPAGKTWAIVPVTIIDDSVQEGRETVVLKLIGSADYTVKEGRDTHALTILDDETEPVVSLVLPVGGFGVNKRVGEWDGTYNFQVKLDPAPTSPITLNYRTRGTATPGSDYATPSGTVSVPAGATTANIPVTIIDDDEYEFREDIVLELVDGTGYGVSTSTRELTLHIETNDTTPSAFFATDSHTVAEGSGTHNVEVELDGHSIWNLKVEYTVGGTAKAYSDYERLQDYVFVRAGDYNKYKTTVTLPVTLIDDGVREGSETVVLTITDNSHRKLMRYKAGSPGTYTLTIVDEPTMFFASASQSLDEGSGSHDVVVRLTSAPTTDITLTYTVGGTATVGSDFIIADSGTVTVPAGVTTATIPVTIIDDSAQESRESVILSLVGSGGYGVGGTVTHTLTIVDDEPTVSFASASQSAGEESGTRNVVARLNKAPATDVTFAYTVGGTATAGSDFIIADSGTLSVPKGATTAAIPVTIIDDSVEDGGETIVLTLTASNGYAVGTVATHTLTIQNHEPPVPSVTVARKAGTASSITEGEDAAFTLTATPAPSADLPVTVTVGTDGDFGIAAGGRTVTIPTAGSATLTLPTTGDEADEPDGSVTVTVTDGDGYTVGDPASDSVTVRDDDDTPPDWTDYQTVVSYLVEVRDNPENTAVKDNPVHIAKWNRVLEAVGHDTGTGLAPMAASDIHANAAQWPDSPFNAASVYLKSQEQQQEPAVTVSAGTSPVTEGGSASFTLTATPPPAADLAVSVTVATDGAYGITAGPQTVTIPTTGSATLTLATTGDDADEPDGSVTVTVTDGNGYTVGASASGSITIEDDDAPATTPDWTDYQTVVSYLIEVRDNPENTAVKDNPVHIAKWNRVLAAIGYTASPEPPMPASDIHAKAAQWPDSPFKAASVYLKSQEQQQEPAVTVSAGTSPVTEGADASFTLTATPPPAADLAVNVTVAADGDYGITAGSRTVTIPPTGSATLTLATTGDATDEPDGSVSVTVNDAAGYTVGDPASDTVAVRDDDVPVVTIAADAASVTEGASASFTLTANPVPAAPLAVSVTVATDGEYGITAGTQTVTLPTTGSATLTLATTDDTTDEPDGSATVTVQTGSGYTVGTPASGTVAVRDDDLPPPVVTIAAKAASVTEGGDAVFTLTADRAPAAALTVELAVSETGEGDHVAASDEGPATVTIAKDTTEAVFTLATVNDAVDEPDTSATVTVEAGEGYTVGAPASGTVTVKDDDASASAVLSVGDSTAKEGDRLPVMAFTVRLSSPAQGPVRVHVSTRPSTPVSARPGQDYAPGSYDLTFRAGETEKQVWILIYDDSHDEGAETFEVVLSQAKGATIGDGVAVGTIVNDDPMPAAWLARFGRTVAEQALDGIAHRMAAPRTAGMQGTLAGRALDFDAPAGGAPGTWSGAGPGAGDAANGAPTLAGTGALALADIAQAFGGHPGRDGHGGIDNGFGHDAAGFGAPSSPHSQSMTAREVLLGSSFSLTGERDGAGGSMAFWGRASQGSFDGREGTFSLDGEATTALLGADYARGRWLVGLALAHSEGEGEYRDTKVRPPPPSQDCPPGETGPLCDDPVRAGNGEVEASLTAAIPYASVQASERLKLWGAVGYGAGEVTLETAMDGRYRADTTWRMAAAGSRGDVLGAPAEGSGPALAVTSDALWARTSSEKTGDLAASDSDVTRLRLGLEGSYRLALENGGSLVPKLELGARHDGGDAETGFGLKLGGGLAWSDLALGLSLDVSGRTLLAHEDDDLKDRGYAASLGFDPDPASERGPSFSLRQELGARATGGLDALFAPDPLEDRTGSEAASRWSMEAAYGVPAFGGRFTGSPHVGLGLSAAARDYSLGWRWTPEAARTPDLSFGLKATRRESDDAAPEHTLGFEIRATW